MVLLYYMHIYNRKDRKVYEKYNRSIKKKAVEENEKWEKNCNHIDTCMEGIKVSKAWRAIKNVCRKGKERWKYRPYVNRRVKKSLQEITD